MDLKNCWKKYAKNSKKGFTVIELLAVVAVLAIASTATISVFIAVHQTVRDTNTITTEQFNSTQIERFIRNEFQVASNVDIYPIGGGVPAYSALGRTPVEDDEYLYYDSTTKKLYFMKCDDSGNFKGVLTIDGVEDVVIDICPTDYDAAMAGGATAQGMNLKLVYNIKTTTYTYSGGIVLGNTITGKDDNMAYTNPSSYSDTLEWNENSADNNRCIVFHSETAEDPSSP